MTGILLESGIVLVPLACAAAYIIVASNTLLILFVVFTAVLGLALRRLRYHYSSGAHGDIIVRAKQSEQPTVSAPSSFSDNAEQSDDADGFTEIVQDARQHCDIDDETVVGSGPLLSKAVTSASTKYDAELYGAALSYDHRCFYIDGRATWVLAADFDYWRIPVPAKSQSTEKVGLGAGDADRIKRTWRHVLLQYKAVGFNAVRIRFHWGFHSPSKGEYDFTGERNIDQLLTLCEEMGILVIACLGPYIGADVQGGGFPFWLIQRDHINLRHLKRSGYKVWDDYFAAAEAEWYDHIISAIVGHELVTKNIRGRGCVIMVQLENHLDERGPLGLPMALQDETRLLARMARERVIRTPLVTNNRFWPTNYTSLANRAWVQVEKQLRKYRIIGDVYRPDISGFTVQDIVSAPVDMDKIASVSRGDNSPMLALELYKPKNENSKFSEQIEAALRQGLSALSLPGFFGLPSWGNIESPELTASPNRQYAAVAEDGSLSDDARTARLVLHIARAFESQQASSDFVSSRPWITRVGRPVVRGVSIHQLPKHAVHVRRQWESAERTTTDEGTLVSTDSSLQVALMTYVDGSSMPAASSAKSKDSEDSELAFMFSLADAPTLTKGSSFALTGTLGARGRGMFVSNIFVGTDAKPDSLLLVAATKEIYARVALDEKSELWVCAEEDVQKGQLFFQGECKVTGHAEVEFVDVEHAKDQKFSFVLPMSGPGVATIVGPNGVSVHVAFVTQKSLDTLVVGYSSYDQSGLAGRRTALASAVAWGVDGILVESVCQLSLARPITSPESRVTVVSSDQPKMESASLTLVSDTDVDSPYRGYPFIRQYSSSSETQINASASLLSAVEGFERRTTNWDTLPWKLLPTMDDLETMDDINVMAWQRDLGVFAYNAIDLGLSASHVLYRCQVRLKPQHLTAPWLRLQLTARHRCTVWVNGINMSGHETFVQQQPENGFYDTLTEALRTPGSSRGPDRWRGTYTYDVTSAMRISQTAETADENSDPEEVEEGAMNEILIAVESYGLGTQSDGFNNARVPRGLIAAYWHGFNLIGEDHDDTEIHDHTHDARTEQLRTRWEICGVDVTKLSNAYVSCGFPDERESSGWAAAVEYPLVQDTWSTRIKLNVDTGVHWLRWKLLPQISGTDGNVAEPIYLHISGKVTAYVWVNGALLAKHHVDAANNDSSVVLLRGGALGNLWSQEDTPEHNVIVMMYGWAEHADITTGNSRAISVDITLKGN
ncbi:hypothetical protein GGI07_003394 [Coemansia sp. Benny D115]|nr:hypothetical protein GGI07_003394 [Coemansia sp. Benny D115]